MVPLIFIGVVLGLLVLGRMFDFFALLGLLGLVGMNIKNAIVLVDQVGIETNDGLPPLEALLQATKSRIVPVVMASGTTILGMLPLLFDAMFGGMAACIMGGIAGGEPVDDYSVACDLFFDLQDKSSLIFVDCFRSLSRLI